MTTVGVVILAVSDFGWFHAVVYAMAAVSTGGFSPADAGLIGANSFGATMVMILAVAGAVPLALYDRMVREDRWVLARNQQFQGLLIAGLATGLVLAFLTWWRGGTAWPEALLHGLLNAFSAQSTAGFSTVEIAALEPGAKLTLIISMMIGGSAGSTAGGIKILRLLILGRLFYLILQKTGMPNRAVAYAGLGGQRLDGDEIQNALCLILFFLILTIISWAPFVIMGHQPLDALFEVVSAIATVGLSAGVAGPELHALLKGVLCADMLLGRLEILAWIVLLFPGTWLGRRMEV
jgi:trk system potassium uptake protein TrkH